LPTFGATSKLMSGARRFTFPHSYNAVSWSWPGHHQLLEIHSGFGGPQPDWNSPRSCLDALVHIRPIQQNPTADFGWNSPFLTGEGCGQKRHKIQPAVCYQWLQSAAWNLNVREPHHRRLPRVPACHYPPPGRLVDLQAASEQHQAIKGRSGSRAVALTGPVLDSLRRGAAGGGASPPCAAFMPRRTITTLLVAGHRTSSGLLFRLPIVPGIPGR